MAKSSPPLFKLSEHQIQDQIIGYLRSTGWYVTRMNSGKYAVGEGRNRRFIMGHEAGTPDLLAFKTILDHAVPNGIHRIELFFIEVKIPGNKPTPLQTAKMEQLGEYGAICIIVHSLDEAISLIDKR